MVEQAGAAAAGLQAQRAALSKQYVTAADADGVLAEALAAAHRVTIDSVSRLDGIAAEIDHAVAAHAAYAFDTAMSAREFQKFLLAKQREIFAVVSHAHELDHAKRLVLEHLQSDYATSAGPA